MDVLASCSSRSLSRLTTEPLVGAGLAISLSLQSRYTSSTPRRISMRLRKPLPRWLSFERMSPALLSGLILFAASFFTDIILSWIGAPAQAKVFNHLAIGFIGALLILFFLSAS